MRNILLIILSIGLLSSCAVRQLDTSTDEFYGTQYSRAFNHKKSNSEIVFVKYSETSEYNVFVTQDDPNELLWAVDFDGDFVTDVVMPCEILPNGDLLVYEGVFRENFKDLNLGEDTKFMEAGFMICDKFMKKGYRSMAHDLKLLQ